MLKEYKRKRVESGKERKLKLAPKTDNRRIDNSPIVDSILKQLNNDDDAQLAESAANADPMLKLNVR